MVVCLIVVYFTAHIEIMAYIMSFVTGLIAFTIGSPIQMMLITSAKGAETLAAAAGQASFNVGNTLGAFFGGIPIAMGFGYNTPVLIGVAMAFTGVVLSIVFLKFFTPKISSI
jgi:DHA1 family arabinose polymer transporter-like MFS transporter